MNMSLLTVTPLVFRVAFENELFRTVDACQYLHGCHVVFLHISCPAKATLEGLF